MDSIKEIFWEYPKSFTLVMLGIIFFNIWCSPVFWGIIGNQDLSRKPDGEYCYQVIVQKKGAEKSYTIPGEIIKEENEYYIYKVYWPNGGYLYFDSPPYCEIGKSCSAYDQEGYYWTLELTNQKAEHESVLETNVFQPASIFWFVFWFILPIGLWLIGAF